MVQARQRFLGRGRYDPLTRRLNRLAIDHLDGVTQRAAVVLEVGCGTGDYLGGLARAPAGAEIRACCFGLDVSKPALRVAARRHPDALFFVNDVHHRICLADASVDVLLDAFAPRNATEFARVMRADGLLLLVIPTTRHLAELRRHVPLLAIESDKQQRVVEAMAAGFRLETSEAVEAVLDLGGEDAADLVRMTPSAWHLDEAERARAMGLPRLEVTASFTLLRFRRLEVRPGP
jgi:23S rRNA (guanine745-N1)-methyltransferase